MIPIQCWDSNSQRLEHESSPINARPVPQFLNKAQTIADILPTFVHISFLTFWTEQT